MSKLELKLKLNPGKSEDDLTKHGFHWNTYTPEHGTIWEKNEITYYGKLNKIEYKKLTQEILNDLIDFIAKGLFIRYE